MSESNEKKSGYDFESIQKKPLKFKGDSGKVKKKKKHKKDKKKFDQIRLESVEDETQASASPKYDNLTPAERKFKENQDKRQMDRILKRASTTHRDRVEEFNRNLDSLSEHYDIPKVSWTK